MTKKFLIFIIFFLNVLCTNVLGQCPQDPNDRGVCDTMYIEPWPSDTIMQGSGPYFVRVPIYVTNDVVDRWDSIPAFVIPLCYNHTNTTKYCSLTAYQNQVLWGAGQRPRSIFRHLPSMDNPLIHNRMMDLFEQGNGGEWDGLILDLDGTSHFWLATIAYFSEDKQWWQGSRVLLATLTFKLQDSMYICIDTCFWPPSNQLAWVTRPAGGGYALTKIPRSGSSNPDDFRVCFNFGLPDPLDCNGSYSDPCLVACPLGDIPFRVYLRNSMGQPVPNYSNVWLDFTDCTGIVTCPSQTSWPIVPPDGPSDANGVATFHIHAGGCNNSYQARIMANCGVIGYVSVKTVDPDGNQIVTTDDWHNVGVDPCNDYNCNGVVNSWDADFFSDHITHGCTLDPCLLFRTDLRAIPDTLLPVGSTHTVTLSIKNNNAQACTAQFVKFYRAGFGQGPTLVQFATNYLWKNLLPQDTTTAQADFIVPGPGSGYLLTKFYSNCCSHSMDATFSFTQRICPPDSMRYVFPMSLSTVPAYVETLEYLPDPRWYWSIYYTGGIPDSVVIITPDTSVLGITGGVSLYFFDSNGSLLGYRKCEVQITLNSGDVNSDCIVNVGDVVYLINYLFKGDQSPDPLRAGDVNCDCFVDIGDVVYLINYLFRSGPPPVSSETCGCGYKEWFPR